MSLLITGGTGYIGKKLTQRLKKSNNSVYSIGIEDLDFLNYTETLNYLKSNNITEIIHLGWSLENTNDAIYRNTEALNNLLKICEETDIEKFIFISTNNVYGTKNIKNLFSEEDRLVPDNENKYGISKYIGEKLVKYTLEEKCCIVRIGDVYGPGQNHGNLLKGIVSNLENGKSIKLYGKGVRERDYIYIDDVIRGLEFIYMKDLSGIYNLGTGIGTSVKKITDIVLDIFRNSIGIDYIEVDKEDTSKVILNVEKLKKLGFSCSISIEEGLKKIMEEKGIIDGTF